MGIRANGDPKYMALYDALASDVRWRIMEMIASEEMNVKEIAACLGLSPAIVTMHLRKLEQAELIGCRRVRRNGGTHKLCSLKQSMIEIELPLTRSARSYREQTIPVGHYTAFEVFPTCGLATKEQIIGQFDDPRYFLDPERVNAAILWFGQGYVEYKTPNYLLAGERAEEIEISMEIASEAPGLSDHWLSDIRFVFNGVSLGTWTSPADFGRAARGKYTPDWWQREVNQYGLWKTIRVNANGTFMDGEPLSDVSIEDLRLEEPFWTLRYTVDGDAEHVGGLTLYGAGFGNHDKDIVVRVYNSKTTDSRLHREEAHDERTKRGQACLK
ncbi:ArsR family transcriptional regulator [Cohnella lubricantis]|uniref:ArsR family transcriptional regulator n=1 Tax=Cohnella lubricantis TaxID=2163172 RepID=A0A841TBD8_9BACL|nr:ArsR family transcriptional regulator [Cohnella lubricantis]MBB6675741.1 ArsR family transcriptional regulator [Cohnella lubricantis]MBP2118885.1 putative transcriptional regulator [Cohnella lubricantis]